MPEKLFYKFHNKIMFFVISIAAALMLIFIVYQFVYNTLRIQNMIDYSLHAAVNKFDTMANEKVDLLDRIARTITEDSLLNNALKEKNTEVIMKRVDFFAPILGDCNLEIIDGNGDYYASVNSDQLYKMTDQFRQDLFALTDGGGHLFFINRMNGIDIKYAVRGNYFYDSTASIGMVIVGFSLTQESPFLAALKNALNSDIMIIRDNKAIASTFGCDVNGDKPLLLQVPHDVSEHLAGNNFYINHNFPVNRTTYSVIYQELILDRGMSSDIIAFALDRKEIMGNVFAGIFLTILSALVVFGILVIFSIYITRRMTTPLHLLTAASEANARGSYVTVNYTANNEIGELITNYNRMIVELKEMKNNLEESVDKRTQELYRSNAELSKINGELSRIYEKSQRELKIAQRVQDALIPAITAGSEVIEISSMYMTIESYGATQYDIFKISESKIGVLLFDVFVLDLPAALLSTLTRLTFRNIIRSRRSVAETVKMVNNELADILEGTVEGISLFYAVINTETGALEYTNGGSRDIYIQKKSGRLILLSANSPKIGSDINALFSQAVIGLDQHDRIIYFSGGADKIYDGNTGGVYGNQRLEEILNKNVCDTSRNLISSLIDDIKKFYGDLTGVNIPSLFSSDLVFIKRESINNPDIAKIKENIEIELPNCLTCETGHTHKIFLKALIAFENGNFDEAIRELNRIDGRYEKDSDTFNLCDLLAHAYYRIESYEQAVTYWERAIQYDNTSECVKKNIEITNKIIDEKSLRRLRG